MTEPSIQCGTTACMTRLVVVMKRRIIAASPMNTHDGHASATSTAVPRTMEGSVKPEHSKTSLRFHVVGGEPLHVAQIQAAVRDDGVRPGWLISARDFEAAFLDVLLRVRGD